MGKGYLIDSNAVIDYLSGNLKPDGMSFMNGIVNNFPCISVITQIEVLSYKTNQGDYNLLSNFVNDAVVLELTKDVVGKTIQIRKEVKIKTPDAIIAATSLVNDYTLITRNTTDFKNIEGLRLINPWSI
ncbi:MAG: type II toxin-antitoxin system VapC family toxin [Bacteroidales bacterium]|nr:type II toxin-antitoxin system VapC family toxin [Bacteroidales bacterium]MCF8339133.1 type II toxin-antitoxin system VapC family toxin [Bacteroidales bacterium]